MTKISPAFEEEIPTEGVLSVSADVSFISDGFPKYKLGPDNQILEEPKENSDGPTVKEVVEQETTHLSEQHKRLSVRDLASKFDKNLVAAAKLSEEAKLREVASLEGHVLLKKLRDALEHLRGRLAGRNKEDVEKAISMASEDAKKLVNQEKSFACAEIESARAVVQRIGEALEEQDITFEASKKQDVEELVEVVQEARRIKLMHQPSKVMDMEHELRALRTQIREKCIVSVKLQKELAMNKRAEENKSSLYLIDGSETLGAYLRIQPVSENAPQLSNCAIQWYRVSSDGSRNEAISGANKSIYAPEPFDVGRILQADIISNDQRVILMTAGPIDPAAGIGSYVDTLLRKSNTEFNVVISKMNGQDHTSHSVHAFHVGKMRMKLSRGWITKSRENYSSSMQLCGVRGDITNAAKALFWQARKGLSFVLTFETERERNAAIILARKYAFDCNIMLAGPDDRV
ncbi:stomatal closure-related actin-binding protein 2 isoform X2 [Pyrus x bretschneideri]|uniref:stomatal closure-related actin-binding protein 2 isoform X2 n=1 Tax=Pyrus x bretschneideri TaxID=225117 RepID=UPI00202F1EF5|nr:stomatal closure-related actin-binding protein 2 isoform X2 [Pyrus x bretschneideri]